MRLRDLCIHLGFAFLVTGILIFFVHNIPMAVLYLLGHLVFAFRDLRKTAAAAGQKAALEKRYPYIPRTDSHFTVGDRTLTLTDEFVKKALLDTILPSDFSAKTEADKEALGRYYSSVRAGRYMLRQHRISQKELVLGNDSDHDYYVLCNGQRFQVTSRVYKACAPGDVVIEVSLLGVRLSPVLIWLDSKDEQHQVAWENKYYRLQLQKTCGA